MFRQTPFLRENSEISNAFKLKKLPNDKAKDENTHFKINISVKV